MNDMEFVSKDVITCILSDMGCVYEPYHSFAQPLELYKDINCLHNA